MVIKIDKSKRTVLIENPSGSVGVEVVQGSVDYFFVEAHGAEFVPWAEGRRVSKFCAQPPCKDPDSNRD